VTARPSQGSAARPRPAPSEIVGLSSGWKRSHIGRQQLRRRPMAHKFEVYKDKAGEFRVRFKYNSEVIFSTEGYSDKSGAKRAIESIKKHVGAAETVEIE
jgi:uncharacterized protein YegP (UPF0339 family)